MKEIHSNAVHKHIAIGFIDIDSQIDEIYDGIHNIKKLIKRDLEVLGQKNTPY